MQNLVNKIKIYKIQLLFIGVLLVGIVIGYFINYILQNNIPILSMNSDSELREGGFTFINPLLQCDLGREYIGNVEINPFKSEIKKIISDETSNNDISFASVYYRDLNNGPWLGINESEKFRPASLLKVLVMIYFLKEESKNPGILDKKLVYKGENTDSVQEIKPSHGLENGKTYTVWEMIEYMIKYSDNRALARLFVEVDKEKFLSLFSVFGISKPTDANPNDFLSVKNYATLFRILFNSTYIGDKLSEKALTLLSKTEYYDGIRKGIPSGINVSNKFGEVVLTDGTKQLHDCGIVYFPKKPYLICVMTRGTDLSKNGLQYSEDFKCSLY